MDDTESFIRNLVDSIWAESIRLVESQFETEYKDTRDPLQYSVDLTSRLCMGVFDPHTEDRGWLKIDPVHKEYLDAFNELHFIDKDEAGQVVDPFSGICQYHEVIQDQFKKRIEEFVKEKNL